MGLGDVIIKFMELIITHWITVALIVMILAGIILYLVKKAKAERFDFDCYVQILEYFNGGLKARPTMKARMDAEKNNLIIMYSPQDMRVCRLPNVSEYGVMYENTFLLRLIKTANQPNTYYPIKTDINLEDVDENGVPDIFESPVRIEDLVWYENYEKEKIMKHRPHAAWEKHVKLMALIAAALLISGIIMNAYLAKKVVSLGSQVDNTERGWIDVRNKELELNTRLVEITERLAENQQKQENLNSLKPPD